MQWWTEQQRIMRKIPIDEKGMFLNWNDNIHGTIGTDCIIIRARRACEALGITLKFQGNEIIMTHEGRRIPATTPKEIGHALTQEILRKRHYKQLTSHLVHGTGFQIFEDNICSNKTTVDIKTQHKDSFHRFRIKSRSDCLATPANRHRWYPSTRDPNAPTCCNRTMEYPTLGHIITGCKRNRTLMTQRHNRLGEVVKAAVEQYIEARYRSKFTDNQTFGHSTIKTGNQQLVRGNNRRLKPDVYLTVQLDPDSPTKTVIVLEFSCPSSRISRTGERFRFRAAQVYHAKLAKYDSWKTEVTEVTRMEVKIYPIIVTATGAVYPESLKGLQELLKCSDRELQWLGQRMSNEVIYGSLDLWHTYTDRQTHWKTTPHPRSTLPSGRSTNRPIRHPNQTSRIARLNPTEAPESADTAEVPAMSESPVTYASYSLEDETTADTPWNSDACNSPQPDDWSCSSSATGSRTDDGTTVEYAPLRNPAPSRDDLTMTPRHTTQTPLAERTNGLHQLKPSETHRPDANTTFRQSLLALFTPH
jgi:hypothetical protein